MRLAFLAAACLLSTAFLAAGAGAVVPDPTRCKSPTDVNCLINQVCNPVNGYSCVPGVPGVPVKCVPDYVVECLGGNPGVDCYSLMAQLFPREKIPTCLGVLCSNVQPITGSCSASEVLCKDVTPLYQQVAVPVAGSVGSELLGLLGGTPAVGPGTIFRNVLVRAAFYCEPPPNGAGSIGQGCQEVVTTGPVRIGNRDTLLHDLNLGPTPLTNGTDCAWLRSTATGYLYVATDGKGWQVVDLGSAGSDCQLLVRVGIVESGAGLGQHAESFRFVYC